MAEPLKISITSDSSELRTDIEKTIKKMGEISDKAKDVQNKLNARNADDFAKTLASNLEEVNKQLDQANNKLADAEEKFNNASGKTHELFQNGADDDTLNKAIDAQQKAEEAMLKAQERVEALQEKQAQITEQTTNQYNAQTDALNIQNEELQQQFSILEGILNADLENSASSSWTDMFKNIGEKVTSIFSKAKEGISALLSKGKELTASLTGNSSKGILGLFQKGTVEKTTSAFKGLTGTVGTFTMALLGARSAYTLIRKATSQILSDNQQLANTVNTIWNGIVAAITPAVNAIVSTFATILNYVISIISYISSIDVLGFMKKAQKKANSATSGSGSSTKKQEQQYSFDTAETIQKQDSSSSGGVANDVNDSYLKGVKLSGTLLDYANKLKAIWADIQQIGANLWNGVKEGLKYMNSGQRILEVGKRLLDKLLDDIKKCTEATVEWSANLDFGPLFNAIATVLESLEPILSRIGDLAVFIYTDAILPIASWVIESALPTFLEATASVLDFISAIIEASLPGLKDLWENVIKPLGEYLGNTFLAILEDVQSWYESATEWINENQELISALAEALGILAVTLVTIYGALEILNAVMTITSAIFAVLTSPITLVIAAIVALIAIVILLAKHWDEVKEKAVECWDNIVATFQGAWEWFDTNIVQPIAEGFSNLINSVVEWVVNCWNNIVSTFQGAWNWFDTNVVQPISKGFNDVINSIVTWAVDSWNSIVSTFQDAWNWFDTNVIQPISSGFKDMVNSIIGWAESMANGIISGVENAVNGVIDILNGFSFDIPWWVPEFGGSHFGLSISHVNYGRVSLPRLAKGAVIPPNQEFLAVLGDQTRGKNIEAPEGLLREIVQEESGSQQQINIVAQGEMSQLIKLLRLKLQEEDKRVGTSLVVGG